jgi:hypothetical protein
MGLWQHGDGRRMGRIANRNWRRCRWRWWRLQPWRRAWRPWERRRKHMPWATVRAIGTVRAAIAHGAGATILAGTGVGISGARVAAQHPWRRRRQRRQRRHDPRSAVEAVGAKDTLFIRDGSRTSIFAYSVVPIVVMRVHVAILNVIAVIRAKHPRRRSWKRGWRGWRRRR